MKALGDNAFQPNALAANAYLIRGRRGLILIDPGLNANLNRIARDLVAHDLSPYHVTDILITHYDFDHATSADAWQHRTGARVWMSRTDADILNLVTPPPNTPFRQAMAKVTLPRIPRRVEYLDGDTEIVDGIRALPTPGHTPGHLAFIHRSIGFIGDAATVSPEATLGAYPAFIDADPAEAERSRQALQALQLRTFCAGHSAPAVRV